MALVRRPGDQIGADVTFKYRGPARSIPCGFGIAERENIGDIHQLVGAWIDVPECPVWTTITTRVQSALGRPAPLVDDQDCLAYVASTSDPMGSLLDSKWYSNVYDAGGVFYLSYGLPCGGIFFPVDYCHCDWIMIKARIASGVGKVTVRLSGVDKVLETFVQGYSGWWDYARLPGPVVTTSIVVGVEEVQVPISFSSIEVWYARV